MRNRTFPVRMPAAACMAALLGACATGPAYVPPAVPVAEGEPFVTQGDSFDPTAALPDDWWKLYDDPVLDALVEQALTSNTDLRIAAANLERARAVVRQARAGRLPLAAASGDVSYGDATGNFAGPGGSTSADLTAGAGIDVAWEVDLFGRVGRTIAAAQADAEAVAAVRDAVRVTVAAETTRSYLDACAWNEAVTVARESHAASLKVLELLEVRERAGAAGMLEVERAAAAAARAQAEIAPLDARHQVALFELAALLGQTPANVPLAVRECVTLPVIARSLPVGDGTGLLRRRPDIREAERSLAAETARIGVAVAELYPSISFGGSGNYSSVDTGSGSFSFSLGPLISWNFASLTVGRARVDQAEASQQAALARFDGTVLTALKEVEQAMANVMQLERRLSSLDEARRRSQTAYGMAEARYRAGSASYLDVLAAQQELLDVRAAHSATSQMLSSARIDLFKALGGGWDATPGRSEAGEE